MASHVYKSIDSADGQFRLLTILPAKESSEEIRGEISCHMLDEKPEYEALSYVWAGPAPSPGKYIRIDSEPLAVYENLFAALSRLRKTNKPRRMWVDAICINQGRDQAAIYEREQQILLMRRIYEQAEQVIIWLGEIGAGERLAVQSLAHPLRLAGDFEIRRLEKKFGLDVSFRRKWSQGLKSEAGFQPVEVGEVAQLLDREWWQRVWVIQELVLAKKAIVMCGPDMVLWKSLQKEVQANESLRDRNRLQRSEEEGVLVLRYTFPDANCRLMNSLREKWHSGAWDHTIYSLLFIFRTFKSTLPSDQIYALLGLAKDIQSLSIQPNYSVSPFKAFTDFARTLIVSHKHLLLFNLKRAPAPQQKSTRQESQVYSLLDQSRFFDPQGLVLDEKSGEPRKGWAKLPHGWERCIEGTKFRFYNHITGESRDDSPLTGQPVLPELPMDRRRELPAGWTKIYENTGNARYVFGRENSSSDQQHDDLVELPTWVPDWTQWSTHDPEPFPALTVEPPRYYASGESAEVQFSSDYDPASHIMKLTGVAFDTIENLASAWCPELHMLPVARGEHKILQEWEDVALADVPDCPYAESGGRYDAFWRTHIADYAGSLRATAETQNYFETWANRDLWDVEISFGSVASNEHDAMFNASTFMYNYFEKPSMNPVHVYKVRSEIKEKYQNMRKRIHRVAIGRRLFVTSRGFIGLAPWNAEKGDTISVLLGGCTPYLLRSVEGTDRYRLVGEAYVYGIMGGEIFSGKMGKPQLKVFDIE